MEKKQLQPAAWAAPKGYSNGIAVSGASQLIFLGGQIGWNDQCEFESDDFIDQTHQALRNIAAILAEAGAGPENILRLTWFVIDKQQYHANLKGLGAAYREVMGRNFPAMSVVEVSALMEDRALLEIEATAAC